MTDKKRKNKQAWCLHTVALLKPYVKRKEHITRTTASRLIKPITDWQRRELDKLRKQANQIIRGENVSALTYGVFGMTLEHPEMQSVKNTFDKALDGYGAPFVMPDNLKIRGNVLKEESAFYSESGKRLSTVPGDAWVITHCDGLGRTDLLIVENDETYVLLFNQGKLPLKSGHGVRCIYPECVVVNNIEIKAPEQSWQPTDELRQYPKAYALSKEHERGDCYRDDSGKAMLWDGTDWVNMGTQTLPPILDYGHVSNTIPLVWIKDIDTVEELPEKGDPGEMYGVRNGRATVDAYYVWSPEGAWVSVMQNTANDKAITHARTKPLLGSFRDVMDQGGARLERTNKYYQILVANHEASVELNSVVYHLYDGYVRGTGTATYILVNGLWLNINSVYGLGEEPRYHGTSIQDIDFDNKEMLTFMSINEIHALGPDLPAGSAFINANDHVVVWMNNEWADMGSFHHHIGYVRNSDGEVSVKTHIDCLREHLGCTTVSRGVLNNWSELPDNPNKGDMYSMGHRDKDYLTYTAVWDGKVWCGITEPYQPISIPVYVIEDGSLPAGSTPATGSDQAVENTKPNGFWRCLIRMLGFK